MALPRKRSHLLVVLIVLASGAQVTAQEAKPTPIPSPPPMVKLSVIVTDSSDQRVSDLEQEDFRVSEDGKPQTITYFSTEAMPVSYGLVLDASGSMRIVLGDVIDTGKKILRSNKPSDETFVMRFVDTDSIQVEHGLTSDFDAISEALDGFYVEGGLTAVIDAVNQSVDYLKKSKAKVDGDRRLAMVLITDGEDRGSRTHADALLNRLREANVQFFVIGLTKFSGVEVKGTEASREKISAFLTKLAQISGGRAFFPKSSDELPGVVDEITRNLHTQYVIGYTSTNGARDGGYRKVQVTVSDSPGRKKLTVTARSGYAATQQ